MRPHSEPSVRDSDHLVQIIDRLCEVLEEECGDNLAAWGSVAMVLVSVVCQMTGTDIADVAEALKQSNNRGRMQ